VTENGIVSLLTSCIFTPLIKGSLKSTKKKLIKESVSCEVLNKVLKVLKKNLHATSKRTYSPILHSATLVVTVSLSKWKWRGVVKNGEA